jgi:hypothetical protein
MTTVTWTKTPRTVIASASNAAGATMRGTVDLRTAGGGVLTIKLTNGATGPTLPAQARVLIAHNSGATPTAASAGADWKTRKVFFGTTSGSSVSEFTEDIPIGVMHLEVEITGNTGQAVTGEAFFSEVTNATGT